MVQLSVAAFCSHSPEFKELHVAGQVLQVPGCLFCRKFALAGTSGNYAVWNQMFHRNFTGLFFFMAEWQNWWYLLWKISRSSLCTSGSTNQARLPGRWVPRTSSDLDISSGTSPKVLEWRQKCSLKKNSDFASGILQSSFPQSRKFGAGFSTCLIE